jgi:hypothetical protein
VGYPLLEINLHNNGLNWMNLRRRARQNNSILPALANMVCV